jgi:hypothetical protein
MCLTVACVLWFTVQLVQSCGQGHHFQTFQGQFNGHTKNKRKMTQASGPQVVDSDLLGHLERVCHHSSDGFLTSCCPKLSKLSLSCPGPRSRHNDNRTTTTGFRFLSRSSIYAVLGDDIVENDRVGISRRSNLPLMSSDRLWKVLVGGDVRYRA